VSWEGGRCKETKDITDEARKRREKGCEEKRGCSKRKKPVKEQRKGAIRKGLKKGKGLR